MKFKSLTVVLTVVLALTAVTPFAAAAPQPNLVPSEVQSTNITQLTVDTETFNAINVIEQYIKIDGDKYILDDKAKDVVSEEIYNNYVNSVNSINEQIQTGTLKIKNGNLTVGETQDNGTIQPYIFGNWYIWGYAITFTHSEVIQQVRIMNETLDTAAFIFAIVAAIPGMQGSALPSAIVAGGSALLINRLSANDYGNGVTLNLHLGYYNVTSNGN